MRKIKHFSILPLFHPPSIFYPLTFLYSQSNGSLETLMEDAVSFVVLFILLCCPAFRFLPNWSWECTVSTKHLGLVCIGPQNLIEVTKIFTTLRVHLVGRVEKREDRKGLVFPHVCLVRGVEKLESGKLCCLVGEKKGRMKNVVYINWLLYPYYIIYKK